MPIYKGSFSVFPVYAGVIPMPIALRKVANGVPRVCGGDPDLLGIDDAFKACSPCMRG